MSNVKVIRLSTGEDVIAKVDEGSEKITGSRSNLLRQYVTADHTRQNMGIK